jgi:hypothetical protein
LHDSLLLQLELQFLDLQLEAPADFIVFLVSPPEQLLVLARHQLQLAVLGKQLLFALPLLLASLLDNLAVLSEGILEMFPLQFVVLSPLLRVLQLLLPFSSEILQPALDLLLFVRHLAADQVLLPLHGLELLGVLTLLLVKQFLHLL